IPIHRASKRTCIRSNERNQLVTMCQFVSMIAKARRARCKRQQFKALRQCRQLRERPESHKKTLSSAAVTGKMGINNTPAMPRMGAVTVFPWPLCLCCLRLTPPAGRIEYSHTIAKTPGTVFGSPPQEGTSITNSNRASGSAENAVAAAVHDEVRALHAVVAGTAAGTGLEFFQSLVRHLAEAIDVHYAVVAEFPKAPPHVRTIA